MNPDARRPCYPSAPRMVDGEVLGRRYGVGVVSLLSGVLVFWIALHSAGSDWYISETHADIIYTGLRRFGEFPFFSFVFNGGSYFLQDPQSNLFSPTVPLILLAGPSIGLRLMEAVWGALGVYAFTTWMARRVSLEAALLGAVASVTSLGVLWKIAVGNDMFLWHLALPGLLWAVERVMQERTIRSSLLFGLILGLLLLGPTFHSFTYLFLPVVPLFVLLEWAFQRPKLAQFGKIVGLLAAGCVLALVIASPKLACWTKFDMGRPVHDGGVISLADTARSLFDYATVKFHFVPTNFFVGTALKHNKWGVEECAVALPPLATLLVLVGLTAIWSRAKRRTALLAGLLIAGGICLTCSWPVWSEFRTLTGGNFRVAPRFLGMAAFGLSVLAALGADAVFTRWKRTALPATLLSTGVMFGSAIWWTHSASQFTTQSVNDTVYPDAVNPFARARRERAVAGGLQGYTELTAMNTKGSERPMLEGVGYKDGFMVVGNDYKDRLWRSKYPLPIVSEGIDPSQVRVEHLRITLNHLAPHARVVLRAREPEFGLSIRTQPPNAVIDVHPLHSYLVVENPSDAAVEHVVLRAQLPISGFWFVASVTGLLAAISALLVLDRYRRREGIV
ncbi:MAG TPA: hypothetical protein VK745_04485, partial [Polyangiaceae bacterium]|nr:hypothetical protein [Polyangiaceae bacterium]